MPDFRRRRAEWLGWGLLAFLAWLVVYPIVLVLIEGIRDGNGWSAEALHRFVVEPAEWRALWASLWLSVASVVAAAVIGVPLAFLVTRFAFPGRRLFSALLALPAVLPPLVGVVAFLFLYGESGFIAHIVRALFRVQEAPWRLEGAGAVLLVHAYSMYVYFYLFTRASLLSMDASVLEAAASLGARRWRTWWKVQVPLLRPALLGAGLLTFMTSLASFSAPYIFGGGFKVMTTQIVATRLNGDVRLAMVETLALTVVALVALLLFRRAEGHGHGRGTGKGVPPAPRAVRHRGVRALLPVLTGVVTLVMLLPHLTLLLVSFVPRGTWTVQALPPVYTSQNYVALAADPERLRPMVTSLWMATVSTLGAVLLALAAAALVVRRRVRAAGMLEGILALPWAVPGTVFAIALATAFSVHAPEAGRLVLVGTVWILPLAYLVRNLPITGRSLLAGFRQLDPSLAEAAATLGAGRIRTLVRITLPQLRPALAAGAALAFVTALGDFVTSIILYTFGSRPISMEILGSLRQSDVGVAAAYGVVLMGASGLVFFLAGDGRRVNG